ncbi:hypothetical protein K0M31_010426 [Melipona bicolor]|uniref:Uncharacterized protein n=1 Tax=Melipona bicolor TaxID=60889 RepID=A0AA40FMK2_9HYME|nr:hypothetical protein K0M31_010426 [Melipona bicolor]
MATADPSGDDDQVGKRHSRATVDRRTSAKPEENEEAIRGVWARLTAELTRKIFHGAFVAIVATVSVRRLTKAEIVMRRIRCRHARTHAGDCEIRVSDGSRGFKLGAKG